MSGINAGVQVVSGDLNPFKCAINEGVAVGSVVRDHGHGVMKSGQSVWRDLRESQAKKKANALGVNAADANQLGECGGGVWIEFHRRFSKEERQKIFSALPRLRDLRAQMGGQQFDHYAAKYLAKGADHV